MACRGPAVVTWCWDCVLDNIRHFIYIVSDHPVPVYVRGGGSNQSGVNLISLSITKTRYSIGTKAFMAWKRILLLTWRHYNLHYTEDITICITCFQWILWFCYQLIIEGRERESAFQSTGTTISSHKWVK